MLMEPTKTQISHLYFETLSMTSIQNKLSTTILLKNHNLPVKIFLFLGRAGFKIVYKGI